MKAIITVCDDNGYNPKDITIEIKTNCMKCKGKGWTYEGPILDIVKCRECNGNGYN
jgi:DnaJ-class molecular chaperone